MTGTKEGFAIPAINCVGSDSMNAVMEAAKEVNSPVIIQISNGGGIFVAGKGLKTEKARPDVLGSIAAAKHVHTLAEYYGVSVILHTDHCAKKLLPWIDGLLDASEKHFKTCGKPLFSSHMLDLSEELLEENREAVFYGVVKMNIDTDTQWATWKGVLDFYKKNEGYLQGQLGNPEGAHKPNKKYYDPRAWLRAGQVSMVARLKEAFSDLNCVNRN